jgi:hypothetical protein
MIIFSEHMQTRKRYTGLGRSRYRNRDLLPSPSVMAAPIQHHDEQLEARVMAKCMLKWVHYWQMQEWLRTAYATIEER